MSESDVYPSFRQHQKVTRLFWRQTRPFPAPAPPSASSSPQAAGTWKHAMRCSGGRRRRARLAQPEAPLATAGRKQSAGPEVTPAPKPHARCSPVPPPRVNTRSPRALSGGTGEAAACAEAGTPWQGDIV